MGRRGWGLAVAVIAVIAAADASAEVDADSVALGGTNWAQSFVVVVAAAVAVA